MSKESKSNELRKWINYFLISIPMTFGLIKIIENKWEVIFWTYFAIGGVSALITRWHGYSSNKSNWLKIAEHICFVFAITMFLWLFWINIFDK